MTLERIFVQQQTFREGAGTSAACSKWYDCVLLNSIFGFVAFTLNEQKIDSWRLQYEVFQSMSVQDPSPRMLP